MGDKAWMITSSFDKFQVLREYVIDDWQATLDGFDPLVSSLPLFPSKGASSALSPEAKEARKSGLQTYFTSLLSLRQLRDGSNSVLALAAFFQVGIYSNQQSNHHSVFYFSKKSHSLKY